MRNKHTPGPWKINDADDKKLFVYNEMFGAVCEIPHGYRHIEEHTANAHLIAAAPDLLQTLIDLQESLIDDGYTEGSEVMQAINKAIAKATGNKEVQP